MSKEHCCCGCIHVKTGALIIGYLVLIAAIIALLTSIVISNFERIVSNALTVIIGGCIIYADRSHKPGGYLPYLIVAAIGIVIYTIFIVPFVIMTIFVLLSKYTQNYGYGTQHKNIENYDLMIAAVMVVFYWIVIWFWMVIYRAYQHMKGVEEYDQAKLL